MTKLENLSKAPETIEQVGTLKINGFIAAFHEGLIIAFDVHGAYFIDNSIPHKPDILSFVELRNDSSDGRYGKSFIGVHNKHALFRIGYDGIETIDIHDIRKPIHYSFISRDKTITGCFNVIINGLGINRFGIFDISAGKDFSPVMKFDEPIDNFVVTDDYVYCFLDRTVSIIALDNPTVMAEKISFKQKISNLLRIDGDIYIAKAHNSNSVIVFKFCNRSPFIEVIGTIAYSSKIYNLFQHGQGFIAVLSPLFRQRIEKISLVNPDRPEPLFTLEAWPVYNICAGNNFFTCLSIKGKLAMDEMGTPAISVLKDNGEGLPDMIGEIDIKHRYYAYSCYHDLIYHPYEKDIRIYRIGLPQR